MDNCFSPRFDAYAATVHAPTRDVLDALEGITSGASWHPMERAPLGYAFGARLLDADGPVAVAFWGGRHEHPHVSFQGEASPAGAAVLRECFPVHGMARGDVIAFESAEPGAYDLVQARLLEVARVHKVKVGTAGDHLLTRQGRTCYLGGTQSAVRVRCYDKAAELRQKLRDPRKLAAVPAELVRFEAQIRPQGEAKRAAARAEPAELLGSARWLREAARQVAGLDVAPFSARPSWREADDQRARWFMLAQYGANLERYAAELGGWDVLGLQLRDELAELRRAE